MTAPSHHVSANGIRIHYLREGAGPTLVLLHGWPEFCRTWRRLMPLLNHGFDLVAPDLRGFGDTEKPDAGPTDRVAGLFFFNCPYPGIGRRWAEPDHMKEMWYQSFHLLPWAADLVGSSRETCRLYIGHFLRHWSGDPHAFDEDLEAWIDNFMKPGNLQGGFNWYIGGRRARLALMRGEAPDQPPIATPTRVLWGARDPILKAEWTDRLPEFFTDLEASVAEEAGHFVQMEQPELAAAAIRAFFDRIGLA